MRRLVVAATAVAVLVPVWAVHASVPASGLRGLAVLFPSSPVCPEKGPCTRPAAHVVLAFSRRGRVVARVRTQGNGRYVIRLQAGTYRISVPAYRIGTGVTPRIVRVPAGRIARVDLTIDTGIQ